MRAVVATCAVNELPSPCLSSALAYFDGYRRANGTNLTQGSAISSARVQAVDEEGDFHQWPSWSKNRHRLILYGSVLSSPFSSFPETSSVSGRLKACPLGRGGGTRGFRLSSGACQILKRSAAKMKEGAARHHPAAKRARREKCAASDVKRKELGGADRCDNSGQRVGGVDRALQLALLVGLDVVGKEPGERGPRRH